MGLTVVIRVFTAGCLLAACWRLLFLNCENFYQLWGLNAEHKRFSFCEIVSVALEFIDIVRRRRYSGGMKYTGTFAPVFCLDSDDTSKTSHPSSSNIS